MRKKGVLFKFSGFTSLEVLISSTILVVLMLGTNGVIASRAKLNQRNAEVTISTAIAQRVIESIKNSSETNWETYKSLARTSTPITANLSSSPFNITDLPYAYKKSFVAVQTVKGGESKLTSAINAGGTVVQFDTPADLLDLSVGTPVTLFAPDAQNRMETVFIKTLNKTGKYFTIDDTKPEEGRKATNYGYGTDCYILGRDKSITISIYYANKVNINQIDPDTALSPIATLTTTIALPVLK